MIDLLKCAFRNLGRKRMRSLLTIMGIAIGVASVVIVGNISQCGTVAVNSELNSLGLGGLSISSNLTAKDATLKQEDLDVIRQIPHVQQAMPLMMQNTDIYSRNMQSKALIWGIDSRANQIISLQVLYGRSISNRDVSSSGNVCLVDENYAKLVYFRENIVGKKINVLCGSSVEEFEVVGVVKTGSGLLQNLIGNYIPTFVYIPYTTLQHEIGRNSFDQIAVRVEDGTDVDAVGANITQALSRSNGIAGGYLSNNLVKQKDGLTSLLDIVTLILSAVGAISLVVASLSIMTVMLVSVNERTREIGIKKSIGAKRSTILIEFLLEALLISVFGCIVGAASGYAISLAGASYFKMVLQPRMDILLLAVGFSLASGIIFGVYPAAKASNLRPVDALRLE